MAKGSGKQAVATTMAFVRMLSTLLRDKELGPRIVPIVPDESRTFGMEGMFRRLGIYSSVGQLYDPVDSDQVAYYREEKDGQILQEGINEAGSMATFIAAVRSDLDDQACQAIALQVASMIEGSMVYTHAGISSAAKQTIFKALRSGIQTLIGADQET